MERKWTSFTRQGNCFFTLFWFMKRYHRNALLSDSGGDLYWTPFGGHSRSAVVPCCLISRAWHTEGAHEMAAGGVNKSRVSPKGLIWSLSYPWSMQWEPGNPFPFTAATTEPQRCENPARPGQTGWGGSVREPRVFSGSPVFMSFSSPRLLCPPLCTKEAAVQVRS